MLNELFTNLPDSHAILTVNQRLSLNIRRSYQQWQHQQGRQTWPSLHVLPLQSWLTDCWQRHDQSDTALMSAQQERYLWLRLIKDDTRYALIQPQQTALQAQNAWQTLHEWDLDITALSGHNSQEILAFTQWANQFQQQCQQAQLTPNCAITKQVLASLEDHRIALPETIFFIGFDQYTPIQQRLRDTLEQHTNIETVCAQPLKKQAERVTLNDRNHEIATMARWAKHCWQDNPNARIGCIIPQLNTLRPLIEHTFIETFDLNALTPTALPLKRPFNFSAGQPLGSYCLINDALNYLSLLQPRKHYPLEQCRQWLHSPYFQRTADDSEAAAAIECALNHYAKKEVTAKTFLYHCIQQQQLYPNNHWITRWRHIQNVQPPHTQAPSQWAQWIAQQLQHANWPGGRNIISLEHQLLDRLKYLLEQMTALNHITPKITFSEARQYLRDTANNTPFQPEGSEAPIQILGVLEAAGYSFDHQWIMNLSDESWPASAQANPFLPITLQRQLHMPHADAQRELAFATTVTERLLASSQHSIVSHARHDGERSLKPSPLTTQLTEIDPTHIPLAESAIDAIPKNTALDSRTDDQAPPLAPNETPQGGTWILKQQAHCPFKAFASIRLKATAAPQPHLGISPAQSGTWVHAALEQLWHKLGNSEQLNRLSESELRRCI